MALMVSCRSRRRVSAGVPAPSDWMESFFREALPSGPSGGVPSLSGEPAELTPHFYISETEDRIRVRADIPGIDAEVLDTGILGNLLTVRGERKEESKEENESFHWLERRRVLFHAPSPSLLT